MMGQLAVALVGLGVFLRIVAKEKHRREKHLLLRLAERSKRLTEQQEAVTGDPGADAVPAGNEAGTEAPWVADVKEAA